MKRETVAVLAYGFGPVTDVEGVEPSGIPGRTDPHRLVLQIGSVIHIDARVTGTADRKRHYPQEEHICG